MIRNIWEILCFLCFLATHSIGTNNQPAETICKEAVRLEEFMQVFFADSVFQRKHVRYPLSLYYGVEQDVGVGIPSAQDTIFIEERNYQVLSLDTRSKIIIYEEDSENPYAVISIPDTALEAELYFLRINGSYVLIKINITGDASPFY